MSKRKHVLNSFFWIIYFSDVETIDPVRIFPVVPEASDQCSSKHRTFEGNLKPVCGFYQLSNYSQVRIHLESIIALLAADVGATGLGVSLRYLGLGVDGLAAGIRRELLQLKQQECLRLLDRYRDIVRQRREISQVESDESRILRKLM